MLVMIALVKTLLTIHVIGLFLPIVWIFLSIKGCSPLDLSAFDASFDPFASQYYLSEPG